MSNSIQSVGAGNPSTMAAPPPAVALPDPAAPETAATKAPGDAKPAPSQAAATLDLSAAPSLKADQPAPPLTMEEAAQAYQSYINNLPSNLEFQPNSEAGMVVFKVVNPVTQKVIRELPPEEVVQQAVAMRNSLRKEHSGILFDQQT